MGFQTCVLMIRGNHLAALPGVFQQFQYQVKAGPTRIADWEQAVAALAAPNRSDAAGQSTLLSPKAACLVNGWTVILDPEMIMSEDEEACARLSRQLKSRVFTMYCHSVTGTYSYAFFDGSLLRAVAYVDGTVEADKGPRQPEEDDVDPADLSEEDVLGVMQRAGVDYSDDLTTAGEYYLYQLGEASTGKRPWWRLWA